MSIMLLIAQITLNHHYQYSQSNEFDNLSHNCYDLNSTLPCTNLVNIFIKGLNQAYTLISIYTYYPSITLIVTLCSNPNTDRIYGMLSVHLTIMHIVRD